uniref:Uncharacterized protein n=1 Tax=Periophthalmus magnuspinnatus TaxID=409849 RepID=A0A3B4BKZ3_9GOBI
MALCSDQLLKVLVIGDVRVGKTSIVLRYVKKSFIENYKTTIGVDFALKTLQWEPRTVIRLQFWDIAGGEEIDLVADILSTSFLRQAVHEKLDIMRRGRPTLALANLSEQGLSVISRLSTMNGTCGCDSF